MALLFFQKTIFTPLYGLNYFFPGDSHMAKPPKPATTFDDQVKKLESMGNF